MKKVSVTVALAAGLIVGGSATAQAAPGSPIGYWHGRGPVVSGRVMPAKPPIARVITRCRVVYVTPTRVITRCR